MLKHLNKTKIKPTRVVVLGSQGFVGRYALRQLKSEGIEAVGISKNEVNLLHVDAEKILLEKLNLQDTLVVVSALAPCKNTAMLIDNLRMMQIVGNVIEKISLSHVVYISSDAAYADDITLATEDSV